MCQSSNNKNAFFIQLYIAKVPVGSGSDRIRNTLSCGSGQGGGIAPQRICATVQLRAPCEPFDSKIAYCDLFF